MELEPFNDLVNKIELMSSSVVTSGAVIIALLIIQIFQVFIHRHSAPVKRLIIVGAGLVQLSLILKGKDARRTNLCSTDRLTGSYVQINNT